MTSSAQSERVVMYRTMTNGRRSVCTRSAPVADEARSHAAVADTAATSAKIQRWELPGGLASARVHAVLELAEDVDDLFTSRIP